MAERKYFRFGWLLVVLAATTLACTCGLLSGLSEAGASLQTAQAFASQAQGLATEIESSGLLETAQAMGTQAGEGGFMETAQAIATSGQVSFGEVPPDIPVLEEKDNLFATKDVVSYFTTVDYKSVLQFYKAEMIANEWKEADGSVESNGSAVLYYDKPNRKATVTISSTGDQTIVQVLIEPKE